MNRLSDEELARRLDREINKQARNPTFVRGYDAANVARSADLDATVNIVNDQWELVDPTPDVHALFRAFDSRFFKSKLQCVQLEWSKRMYNCAGICYQRTNRLGKSCVIRLSEPLLKLRTRKDLVETLLHEMIHAYCFVQGIREGNGGHGPTFCEIMRSINKVAGTNISVYHSFYDEVNLYKTHVWRCNGVCQHRGPFYGYVRRTMNRAPGPSDYWFMPHKLSCGGHFQKVQEPEKEIKTKGNEKKSTAVSKGKDIRTFFPPSPQKTQESVPSAPSEDVRNNVRNIWKKKFNDSETVTEEPPAKRPKTPQPSTSNLSQPSTSQTQKEDLWKQIDDDIFIQDPNITVIDLVDSPPDKKKEKKLTPEERQTQMKKEIMDSIDHDGDTDTVIELIDDEYDEDDVSAINTVLDESVIEDLFGKDTLMDSFKQFNNNATKTDSASDLVNCPVCQGLMTRDMQPSHMEGCLGILEDVPLHVKPIHKPKARRATVLKKPKLIIPESSSSSPSERRSRNGSAITYNSNTSDYLVHCPVCNDPMAAGQVNDHLDICLLRETSDN
ncbi:uncharacterized protein DMENIID0001_152790 [Sergentomyia squamirostris]